MSDADLTTYRLAIQDIDEEIMKLIAKRQAQVIKIAHLKAGSWMAAHQPVQHQAVIEARQRLAADHGLDPAMVTAIWQLLMAEAIRIQNTILLEKKP